MRAFGRGGEHTRSCSVQVQRSKGCLWEMEGSQDLKFPHLLAVSAPLGVPVGGQGWLSSNEGETREQRKDRTQALGGLSAIRQDCHVV